MLLIAYDGSDNAKAAIAVAARLMPDRKAVVVTGWEPYNATLARTGAGGLAGMTSAAFPDLDQQSREHGERLAEEGAALAIDAGLIASAHPAATAGSPARLILELADELDAETIVVGTRGNGALKSLVLGSVSHGVVQHATRPVLVVPPAT